MLKIKSVDAKTANEWLQKNNAMIIDVRESEEYNAMHIPGSHHIPVGLIYCELLPEHANKKLILHCKMGMRSKVACEKLLTENPNLAVYNLEGGILAWIRAGFKVEKNN